MKALRLLAALFVAFGSLFFATPAHAQTLEEAQAALVAGQQELVSATQALSDANAALDAAAVTLSDAQAAYDAAHAAKLATAVEHPAVTTTSPETNVVVNGTFDSTQGWTNVVASSTVYTGGASPIIYNGTLKGSYSSGYYIQQTGTFATPTRQVTFSVDVFNYDTNEGNRVNNPDYYRIEFRTYNAAGTRLNYYNLEVSQWHNSWITRGATYTLADDAVRWDIGFRMADGGYWAGAFGPVMDNVKLLTASTTTTPAYTTYGEAEAQAEVDAQTALTAAQAAYSLAASNKSAAQNRYDAAVLAIPALEAAVTALTPVTPPWWAQENGEGETVTITAPDGWEFYSVRAWYGSPTDETCGQDVSSVLGPLMIGQHSVTVTLDNGTFGDPCGGVVKVTRLTWSVVQTTIAPVPTPTSTPEPTPTQEPSPTSTPEPSTTPQPEPTASTSPTPSVTETPAPTPSPTVEPLPQPDPSPSPTPGPVPVPPSSGGTDNPRPEPSVTPSPIPTSEPEPVQPTPEPTVEPTPEPTPTVDPSPEPTQPSVEPQKEPDPVVVVPPVVKPDPPVVEPVAPKVPVLSEKPTVAETVAVMDELTTIAPEKLTDAQVEVLVAAAEATFLIAEPGSPAYEQALDALAVAAQADDPELPAELAAIPGAAQVLEAFNALGNVGADMSPKQREQTRKEAIALVAVGQVAAAASAAAASAGSASSRRKP